MTRGRVVTLATLSIAFLVLVIAGAGFQWVNEQPWFCNTCHEMNFHYHSWQVSTHHTRATCLECHAEPGLRGLIEEKVRGLEQLVAHVTGHYTMPLKILVRVRNDQCLACHPKARTLPDSKIVANHALHLRKQVLCADCHNRIVHNQPGHPRVIPRDQCDACHQAHVRYPLAGKHATFACSQCHREQMYNLRNCEGCHKPPAQHVVAVTTGCERCHGTAGWRPAKFDHPRFPLTGKHHGLACGRCHKGGVFAGLTPACASCHQPPASHAGIDPTCARCHTPQGFKPASFAHKPVGEHMGPRAEHPLPCARCHPVQFTATTCRGSGCHRSDHPRGEGG